MAKKKKNENLSAVYVSSSFIDGEAISALENILYHNRDVIPDLKKHDTRTNTDGLLQLVASNGETCGELLAQVKTINFKDGKPEISFTFKDKKFLNYCKKPNILPILFVGVDRVNMKAYWVEMSSQYVNGLKSKSIKIPIANVIEKEKPSYYKRWKKLCDFRSSVIQKAYEDIASGNLSPQQEEEKTQISAIKQLTIKEDQSELLLKNQKAVDEIINNIKEKILLYEGHLFLVSPTYVNNSNIRETIRENLGISLQQEELFIDELTKQNILSKTGDVVVFNEDALGQEKLLYLAKNGLINIDKIYDSFPDIKIRKTILKKAVNIVNVEKVDGFFDALAKDFLSEMGNLASNDDVVANVELLNEYSFRIPKQTIEIVRKILSLSPLPVKTYDSDFGKFDGASHDKVLIEILDVIDSVRYLEVKDVIEIATFLSLSESPEVKKKALEIIKHTSEYNIFALKRIGYYPQKQLLTLLQSWTFDYTKSNLAVFMEASRDMLSSEFEGSQMTDYRTFTLSYGPLNPSEELKEIRNGIAELIKNFYTKSVDSTIKVKLLNILEEGSRTPNRGNYSNELEALILGYVNDVLMPFYLKIIKTDNFLIVHEIESQLYWFARRFEKNKVSLIGEIKAILKENKLYQIFRVFYGYDRDFDEELEWREAREKRDLTIDGFVNEISDSTFLTWEKNILLVASNYTPEDPGKFMYFNSFIYKFAKNKPSLAFKLLSSSDLQPFLTHILIGLWESEQHDDIRKILLSWAEQSKELSLIAGLFWYTKKADADLMIKIFVSARDSHDSNALNILASNIAISYQGEANVKKLFMEVINELTKMESTKWTFNFFLHDSALLKLLSEREAENLLGNLLFAEDISHDIEEILLPIAETYPVKVIQFFYKRIKRQIQKKKDSRYDAIPYDFHELPKILIMNTDLVLDEIFKWFKEDGWLFHFDGPRFLKEIFPSMDEPLKSRLIKLIRQGGKTNAEVILRILRAYEGHAFSHQIIKAFIKKYLQKETSTTYKDYLSEIFIALSTTGVVSGEYGLPNAYKQKKEEIQSWKSDKSKSIQVFVKKYEDYMDKQITYHTKRADEDIELMKRGAR